MSTEGEEWGPWIDHDGMGCPCAGRVVMWEIHYAKPVGKIIPKSTNTLISHERDKAILCGIASKEGYAWNWANYNKRTPEGKLIGMIVRYRMKKPLGLKILERLLEDLPKTCDDLVKEKEDA